MLVFCVHRATTAGLRLTRNVTTKHQQKHIHPPARNVPTRSRNVPTISRNVPHLVLQHTHKRPNWHREAAKLAPLRGRFWEPGTALART
jgi:hypothetical protein